MRNKIENEYHNILTQLQQNEKKLLKEEIYKKIPSHYTLSSCVEKIINLLKNSKIEDQDFEKWASWRIRELDIFLLDLDGILGHDYRKGNKRYREKWLKEKRKIDHIVSDFQTEFHDRIQK